MFGTWGTPVFREFDCRFGDAPNESVVIDENTPEIPGSVHSLYSGSKGEAEKIVWKYVRQGLDVVIVNPAIILGAGLRGRSSVKLFEQASKGMPFYTEGVNGYVDVRDVCELMIRLAKRQCYSGRAFRIMWGKLFLSGVVYRDCPCRGQAPTSYSDGTVDDQVSAWRLLAFVAPFTGKKPAFTEETARSSQHKSRYSSAKVLSLFPDFHFHTLEETTRFFKDSVKRVV